MLLQKFLFIYFIVYYDKIHDNFHGKGKKLFKMTKKNLSLNPFLKGSDSIELFT